jgi:hypothetical protein
MKRWKAVGLLIAGYVGYVFYGGVQGFKMTNKYEALAVQKADTNHDGKVDVEEAMACYKSLGLNGDEIIRKICAESDEKETLVDRLFDKDRNRRISLEEAEEALKSFYGTGNIDLFLKSVKPSDNYHRDFFIQSFRIFTGQGNNIQKGSELERYVKGGK